MSCSSSIINFDLSCLNYPESFPRSISLDESDPLTSLSFKESYQAAQDAGLPYYSVAVVESGIPGEKYYHVYDTSFLTTHVFNKGPFSKDPLTGRPIQKVHFFAVECFKFDQQTFCRPLNLSTDDVKLSQFKVENDSNPNFQTILLDSVNHNIIFEGSQESKSNVRRMQYIIASYIQKGEIFPHLDPFKRKEEEMRWLWSSAQGSYVGLVSLVKECLGNQFFSKECMLNLLSKRLSIRPAKDELSLKESKAVVEAIDLLRRLERDIDHAKRNGGEKRSIKSKKVRNLSGSKKSLSKENLSDHR